MIVTRLSDGAEVVAVSTYAVEHSDRARELGYHGTDAEVVDAMNHDHDAVHQAIARLLGFADSPTLHWVANGAHPSGVDLGGYEERVVFLFQAALNGRDVLADLRSELAAVRALSAGS